MSENKLAATSDEKLLKQKSLLKGILIGFGIVWLILIALVVYLQFFSDKPTDKLVSLWIPIIVLPSTMLPVFIGLGQLNKELSSRNLK